MLLLVLRDGAPVSMGVSRPMTVPLLFSDRVRGVLLMVVNIRDIQAQKLDIPDSLFCIGYYPSLDV